MELVANPGMLVRRLTIGRELAPLLVIDDAVGNADSLVELAAGKIFSDVVTYYPGIRAKAPLSYQQFLLRQFHGLLVDHFALAGKTLRFTACHFSLVTKPSAELTHLQRIPHVDSVAGDELAFVHYLFRQDQGGTAFYRHRKTGFEFVDAARQQQYFADIELENIGPDKPMAEYINGDTPLYEQVARQDGVFNRLVIYRRNSLHSACIGPAFSSHPGAVLRLLDLPSCADSPPYRRRRRPIHFHVRSKVPFPWFFVDGLIPVFSETTVLQTI